VFENRVFRRIFGPKSDEVTGECRRLHNEEQMEAAGAVETSAQLTTARCRN
jgi:hypothetical protein